MLDDDADDRDDSKRKTRNLSEKKRRDQFNLLVNELNSMISTSNRKMDKSTVLKSTISFLKTHNETTVRSRVNEIQEDWKPSFLSNEEFTHLILEALDGFIMVFTSAGKINYASEGITSLLGHLPNDLLNTSIYEIAFDDDRPDLFNVLQNSARTSGRLDESKSRQIVFACHLKRGCLDYREGPIYELVQFTGYFRGSNEMQDLESRYSGSTNESYSRSIFVCTGRLQIPQLIRDMSVVDSSKSEFTSRHSLEWKFLFLDHRAPPIIGYLPFEVLGTSGYDYYHFDDLEKVVNCHEALMQKGEGTSCYYRFLTKGQQWIWLQTRFYITYHQWNSKPEFVVCTHRVVSYRDVIKSIHKDPEYNVQSNPLPEHSSRYYDSQSNMRYSSQSEGSSFQSTTWRKRSSKISKCSAASDVSSSNKRSYSKRFHCAHGSGHSSDTASISTESVNPRLSPPIYQNTHSVIMHAAGLSSQPTQFSHPSQQSNPVYQPHQQFQQIQQPRHLTQNCQQPQNSHEMQQVSETQEQLISHYVEPQSYLTLPIAPTISFSGIQPLPSSSDIGITITPNQAQMQEQLQKKHEELKKMIKLQQEELQRVSEQLVMARYGLLPPIINVAVPYNGIVQSGNNITWNEPFEMYSTRPLPPVLPQQADIEHQNQQQISEQNNFSPMQMSQHQAQLLFSSTDNNQNIDRPG